MPKGKATINGLTAAQEAYCRARAEGLAQGAAYKKANPNSKGTTKTQKEQASRMEHDARITQRIRELQERAAAGAILNIAGIQSILAEMSQDDTRPDGVRLKALDQLTRMSGGYLDRLDVSGRVSIDGRRDALDGLT